MDIIPSPKSWRRRTSLNTNSHLIDKRARVFNFLGEEQRLDSREWLSSLRLRIQIAYILSQYLKQSWHNAFSFRSNNFLFHLVKNYYWYRFFCFCVFSSKSCLSCKCINEDIRLTLNRVLDAPSKKWLFVMRRVSCNVCFSLSCFEQPGP